MKRTVLSLIALLTFAVNIFAANPVNGLLERIQKGASQKFIVELKSGPTDYFELSSRGNKVVITSNTWVNASVGVNWYLKYYCGIHLSWNQMHAKLPAALPFTT